MPDQKDLPPLFDKSALVFIRRNIQTLVHLVTELLDFTHVANGVLGLKLEKVDAHEVIRFVLGNSRASRKGRGLASTSGYRLSIATSEAIRANSNRFCRI